MKQEQPQRVKLRRAAGILLISAVVALALGLRAYPVRYSLPYVDHPDEPNLVGYALHALQTGDLNPHFFQKPSLSFYLLLPFFWLHYRWGLAVGVYSDIAKMSITTHLYTTVPDFFITGRLLVAALGTITVLLVDLLGRRAWNQAAGLVGALFLATLPFHLDHSRYVTTDVPSALFVLLAFMAALNILYHGAWRAYLAAGIFAGLSAATKYNAGAIVTAILAAHVLHAPRQAWARLPRLIAAGAASLGGFLIGTPYALLAWPEFQRGILGQVKDYGSGIHGDYTGAWNVAAYVDFFWTSGLGPAGCIATVTGLALLAYRRRAVALLWLSFGAPYLLLLVSQRSHFMRNMMPLVVLCALPIGIAGAAVWDALGRRVPSRLAPLLAAGLIAVALATTLPAAITDAAKLLRPDSRVVAQQLAHDRYPGVRIASEVRQPLLWNGLAQATPFRSLAAHDLAWFRQQGYSLLIASSTARRAYQWTEQYAPLVQSARIVATFGRPDDGYRGPQIDLIETGLDIGSRPAREPRAQLGPVDLQGATIGVLDNKETGPEVSLTRELASGQMLAATLYWSAPRPAPAASYVVFLHLLDAAGNTAAQTDIPLWRGLFPPQSWKAGSLVVDQLDLPLPPRLASGEYRLVLGMYDGATGERFPATAGGARIAGDTADLGTVRVRR